MPFSIFEYQDMMRPMGLSSPAEGPYKGGVPYGTVIQCNNGSYDVANGIIRPCLKKGGVKPTTPTTPQKCPMDMKSCPGGGGVGRTGPNCTFPPCPTPPVSKCAPTYKSGNCSYRLI